jgi:hypothetical protein
MKKINKIIIGIFTFAVLLTLFNVNIVSASPNPPVDVGTSESESYSYRILANHSHTWRFQLQTRLTVQANISVQGYINCSEAPKIGDKHFEIDIEAENDLEMNMTCTEEQHEKGLLLGSRHQVRNRNRNLLYQEGFCIRIQTNKSGSEQIKAQLKIQANQRNREGSWAFYDETEGEWVAVETAEQNGYLVCETNHFSTWTILIPESDNVIWGFVGVGAVFIGAMVIAVVLMVYKKRK